MRTTPNIDSQTPPSVHPPEKDLSVSALEQMARLAWRNNAHCIGRLLWETLHLLDARTADSPDEVFEACVRHIDFATNNGSIRPAITVFASSETNEKGIRFWNSQLIRYAGYRAADGTVLGDPAETEFTARAIEIGWQPPRDRSAFDLLPIVVEFPGHAPRWFELPKKAVMEVQISHPEFSWFAEMGLKWHALPSVCNLALIGNGQRFTAAPFSGFYMGTEIASRNFGDETRYNLLPEVANRMGIDRSKRCMLWKDRALVELNTAVCTPSARQEWPSWITTLLRHNSCSMFSERKSAGARCPATGRGWCRQCPVQPARSSIGITTTAAQRRPLPSRTNRGKQTIFEINWAIVSLRQDNTWTGTPTRERKSAEKYGPKWEFPVGYQQPKR